MYYGELLVLTIESVVTGKWYEPRTYERGSTVYYKNATSLWLKALVATLDDLCALAHLLRIAQPHC